MTAIDWQARAERADAEIDKTIRAIGDRFMLVPPDGGDVKPHEGAAAMASCLKAAEAIAAELDKALETLSGHRVEAFPSLADLPPVRAASEARSKWEAYKNAK
jgi:hypothetical protein